MSEKVIPFPRGRRAAAPVPRERAARFDIKRYPPRAILSWLNGLANPPTIYTLGENESENDAILMALEKALRLFPS